MKITLSKLVFLISFLLSWQGVRAQSCVDQTVTTPQSAFFCEANTTIDLSSSEVGVDYYLRKDADNSIIDGPIAGTGSAISFNTGDITSTTTFNVLSQGPLGSGLAFDGVNDEVSVSGGGAAFANLTVWSMEMWVRIPVGAGNQPVFSTKNNSVPQLTTVGSGILQLRDGKGTALNAEGYPDDGEWHHVAFVSSGANNANVYVDGSPITVTQNLHAGFAADMSTYDLIFGWNGFTGWMEGDIAEFRFWNTARTSTEISTNLNTDFAGSESGLIMLYEFAEGSGTSTADATTNYPAGSLTNMDPATDWIASIPSCELEMTDKPTVTINPIIDQSVAVAQTTLCPSNTGTTVNLTTSQTGVSYYLRDDADNSVIDGPVAGGGALALNTGSLASTTTFNVLANAANSSGALDFDGVDELVSIPHNTDLVPTGGFSVEVWAKGDEAVWGGFDAFISKRGSSEVYIISPIEGSTSVYFILGTTAGRSVISYDLGANGLAVNEWHHYSFTYDGTTMGAYIDGVEVGTATTSGALRNHVSPIYIGRDNCCGARYFDGQIDDVRIWNYGRSSAEINADINSDLEGTETGLVAYYDFEDGAGTTLTDRTGNGHDGTLTNMEGTDWVNRLSVTCEQEMTTAVTVTVEDNIAPVADATSLEDLTGECSVAAPTAPTATDNCEGTITGVADVTFPITAQGTTVVTWSFDDGNGNVSTQTQNVVIDDVTAAVADAASLADLTGECSVAAPTAPTATDNCEGTITGVADVTFPIMAQGTTVVTWSFDDGNGNVSTQTQNVVIDDVTAPVADAASLADLTGECSVAAPTAPTGTDNCEGTITGVADVTFPITAQGTTVVTWSFDDGNGNVSTQTQNVVIDDVTAPVADATSLADLTGECSVAAPTAPTATDNCEGTITGVADVTFPITVQGTTVVTWSFDDGNGNVSTQTQNVVIDDVTAPVADATSLTDLTGECSVAAPTAPTATDNCEGTITGVADVTFPITAQGTTVVTWSFDDGNGNVSTQTQNVVIDDVTAPVADATSLVDLSSDCELTSLTAPTATDDCSGEVEGSTQVELPITESITITWTYADANGNTSTQTQEVIINKTTWYADSDGDGFGDAGFSLQQCEQPENYVIDNTDCDDTDANVYPEAPAMPDGKDNNCDGEVDKVDQNITFPEVNDQELKNQSLILNATASSELEVSYTIISGPATVTANVISFTGSGEVVIEAMQGGDEGYNAAEPVTRSFTITSVTSNSDLIESTLLIYPNPVKDLLTISNVNSKIDRVTIINVKGEVQEIVSSLDNVVNVNELSSGVYLIMIDTKEGRVMKKFIKN